MHTRLHTALALAAGVAIGVSITLTEGVFATKEQHQLDKELAAQAELAYRRLVQDWQPAIKGTGAAPGRASRRPSTGQAARQETAPPPAL